MRIIDETEIPQVHNSKRTLNTPERLFDKEGKKVRLTMLAKIDVGKAAIVELSEFGTNKKSVRNFDWKLNQVFILGEIPLMARKSGEEIVIRKMAAFDLEEYNKGDKKGLSANHAEMLKAKLDQLFPIIESTTVRLPDD